MRVQDVVIIARDVHLKLAAPIIPVSIHKIKDCISESFNVTFDMFDRVSWRSNHILGRLLRYEREGHCHVKIAIADNLNTCWTRFVACKEMAHILADHDDGDFTSNPVELVRLLVDSSTTARLQFQGAKNALPILIFRD